jgi:hypothetical protein
MIDNPAPTSVSAPPLNERIEVAILEQSMSMLRYALGSGMNVPPATVQAVAAAAARAESAEDATVGPASDDDIRSLSEVHASLAQIVAPATPHTLVLLGGDHPTGAGWKRVARIPLVAQMMTAAVIAIIAFIGLSLTGSLKDPVRGNLTTASGLDLLLGELFFLSASALGAAFSSLFEIMRSLDRGDLDLRRQYTYWIKFLLGLVAGLILATILHVKSAAGSSPSTGAMHLSAAGLALLGGYSTSVFYRVLQRLTTSVTTLLTGNVDAEPDADANRRPPVVRTTTQPSAPPTNEA